uniref:Uncharacterized protein n=1 Tax=Thermosporothrix sp. COM3 TaxID=2490863 RepID=A0A455SDR6_9CHLR|nr:hypothetical protein KTC_06570 [Thermosporothrix sp. COM3]
MRQQHVESNREQIAQENHLGIYMRDAQGSARPTGFQITIFLIFALVFAFGALIFLMTTVSVLRIQNWYLAAVGLVGTLVCGYFAYTSFRSILRRKYSLYLYQRGFIFQERSLLTVFRWDDISAILHTEKLDNLGHTNHVFAFQRKDGKQLMIDNTFADVLEIGEQVQRAVNKALIPEALAQFKAGKELPFNGLSVSQAGLKKGEEVLPWDEADVEIFSEVTISKKGEKRSWYQMPLQKFANVPVLIALIRYVRKGQEDWGTHLTDEVYSDFDVI